jgi:hypothetical protein
MVNDIAKTVSTIAMWGAVAGILTTLRINGDGNMVTDIMVGMTAFLSAGAAFGTFAVWRSPRPAAPSSCEAEGVKIADRDL